MKIKVAYLLSITIMVSLMLISCSTIFVTATPTPTLTPSPTITFTPTLTSTPTITPSPTETPDPNKPLGATGFDQKSGYYTKTVNGKTYYWIPIQMTTVDGKNGIKGHWFESHMAEGPINLTEGKLYYTDVEFTLNMNVYFIENYEQLKEEGYLIHQKCSSNDVTAGCDFFPNTVIYDLFLRYYNRDRRSDRKYYNYLQDPKDIQRVYDDMIAFINKLKNGEVISSGEMLWQPRKGYEVFFINFEDAAVDTSFYFTQGIYKTFEDGIYWKVMVVDGKLIAIIADDEQEKMDDEAFRRKVFLPLDEFVHGENPLSDKIKVGKGKFGVQAGSSFSVNGVAMNYNYIDIIDK